MPDPCPCGTQIKTGQKRIAYITQDVLDLATPPGATWVVSLIEPLYGRAVDLNLLCASPAPMPPTPTADWLLDPISAMTEILAAVLRISWNLWCECTPCPPIAGCSGTNLFHLGPSDGYCHDEEVIGGVTVCVQREYKLNGGQTCYVKRDSDGHCFGPFSGLAVDWITNSTFDPNLTVLLDNYGGGAAVGWQGSVLGQAITVYVGDGAGGGPVWHLDTMPITADDPPVQPACDPTTICTAVDYIRERVNVLDRMLALVMQANNIELQSGTLTIPGQPGPITGPIADWLLPAVKWLLPITPAQLSDPDTTPLATSGALDVTGRAFVEVLFTAVPSTLGIRGSSAPVYFYSGLQQGPGWVIVAGDYGAISQHWLAYPQGVQIELPQTATTLLFELAAGVEIAVTTFARSLS